MARDNLARARTFLPYVTTSIRDDHFIEGGILHATVAVAERLDRVIELLERAEQRELKSHDSEEDK